MSDLIKRDDAIKVLKSNYDLLERATLRTDKARRDEISAMMAKIMSLPSAGPKTGECETCKRNADNGGFYDDGRTRCPIQEHYALLKDGYCHLYEPRMRGEEE